MESSFHQILEMMIKDMEIINMRHTNPNFVDGYIKALESVNRIYHKLLEVGNDKEETVISNLNKFQVVTRIESVPNVTYSTFVYAHSYDTHSGFCNFYIDGALTNTFNERVIVSVECVEKAGKL